MRRGAGGTVSVVIATILSGCATLENDPQRLPEGPDFVAWVPRQYSEQPWGPAAPPPSTSPDAKAASAASSADVADPNRLPRPAFTWWTELGSPELNSLVESALANNFDLRVAVARVEQAERQALAIQGARYPSVDFFAGADVRGPADGPGRATSREDFSSRSIFQFGFRATYEADLWGRVGYQIESALARARADAFNREAVGLTIAAEVSLGYLQILSLDERVAISERNLAIARDISKAISQRVEEGDSSVIELQRQQVGIALIENTIASLRLQRARIVNRLAVFLGQPPGTLKFEAKSLQGIRIPRIDPGLPSELLCRRPDIRRAEAELVAASADVKVARASLLPSVSLTAEWGQGSEKLSDLLRPESLLYTAAANLVQSVFDAERRENQIAAARARNRELLERYASVVLGALRDVEDALAGIRLTALQQQALAEALARNSRVLEFSQKIYDRGALEYVALLDTQRDLFLAQDSEASARFEQVRASIDLFRALGGGTLEQNDPCIATPQAVTGTAPSAEPASDANPSPAPTPVPTPTPRVAESETPTIVAPPPVAAPKISSRRAAERAAAEQARRDAVAKRAAERAAAEQAKREAATKRESERAATEQAKREAATKREAERAAATAAAEAAAAAKQQAEANAKARAAAERSASAEADAQRDAQRAAARAAERAAAEQARRDAAAKRAAERAAAEQAKREAAAKREAERAATAAAASIKRQSDADAKARAAAEAKAKRDAERIAAERAKAEAEADKQLSKERGTTDPSGG